MTTDAPTDRVTVDPTLETWATALRSVLDDRGVPADMLDDVTAYAVAYALERTSDLHTICRSLHDRLERLKDRVDAAERMRAGPSLPPMGGAQIVSGSSGHPEVIPYWSPSRLPIPLQRELRDWIDATSGPPAPRDPDDVGGHPGLP
jgi:hypothetical protein